MFLIKSFILVIWEEMTLNSVNTEKSTTKTEDENDAALPTLTVTYNILIHILLYGYTIYMTYVSVSNPITLFTLHAPLSALGVSKLKFISFIQKLTKLIISVLHLYDKFYALFFEYKFADTSTHLQKKSVFTLDASGGSCCLHSHWIGSRSGSKISS